MCNVDVDVDVLFNVDDNVVIAADLDYRPDRRPDCRPKHQPEHRPDRRPGGPVKKACQKGPEQHCLINQNGQPNKLQNAFKHQEERFGTCV